MNKSKSVYKRRSRVIGYKVVKDKQAVGYTNFANKSHIDFRRDWAVRVAQEKSQY